MVFNSDNPVFRKVATLGRLIKVEHTVFALPFAYLGALLAADGSLSFRTIFWITVAMAAARTAAMGLNRVIDRTIDAANPRTAARELPRGLLRASEVWALAFFSLAVLLLAAAMLNPLCVRLLPIAVVILLIYPYTKRWTWACHWILGIADGLAPLGGWVAVRGSLDWGGLFLLAAVACWVGGFDIIYACLDYEFDRSHGLHSLPARLGLRGALRAAQVSHLAVPVLLVAGGKLAGAGICFYVGVLVAAGLLIYEHRLISPRDLSRLNVAFLNVNGYLSLLMLGFTILDYFLVI